MISIMLLLTDIPGRENHISLFVTVQQKQVRLMIYQDAERFPYEWLERDESRPYRLGKICRGDIYGALQATIKPSIDSKDCHKQGWILIERRIV
jgi:hypothetical protein